ncbi:NAD(P)/FAD-dependent oxidoreductase [Haloechinothrix sp. YIM 98757]|uniref:NAD(P)/FAD-dependent oxidoreductase n=1 Tax=Haloechinothrix aidingensis TaxID=2752311 RepID=A0A838AC81_9PSEU|nr:NAD(P)/FAD-dependent oxidoreductase [Haloechinothrix aidingensis]MBA0126795.1 NAD(P)/FAD-dependent oxidoreductase [Haloechinothrix aidingensis]
MTVASDGGRRERLAEAVDSANIPTLLMVNTQLTGDLGWLSERYRPSPTRGLEDNDTGDLPADVQAEVRTAAVEAISAWQAGEPPAIPTPSDELMVRMLSFCMGDEVPDEYGPMLADDLEQALRAFDEEVPAPATTSRPTPSDGFRVLVVGAGISGLCAAVMLQRLGVEFEILEKSEEVGGTWREHQYPGAGVDTPTHLYSFSFAPYDWSQYFALRGEIFEYLQYVASEFDVRQRIQFQTEVREAAWDSEAQLWKVDVQRPNGVHETLEANVVISAVGAFNPPVTPDIPGVDRFRGPAFHTARWPDGLDVEGKQVAVIGNGASAMQLVPAIAGRASSVKIFQRSPQWAQPFPKFQQKVPDGVRHLFQEIPLYYAWYRLRQAWIFHDKLYDSLQKDPQWPHSDRSINATNDRHRKYLTKYIQSELGDRTDLLDKVLPTYPPFGKRMLLDNGWYRCLTRDDVQLTTDSISRVDPGSIVTSSGDVHEADVLVFATGFDITRFVSTMEVRGRHGSSLRETWDDDDCRAFLGMAVPGFPNFFCLYGPNTQPGHGGSLITTVEEQVHYLEDLLRQMLDSQIAVAECRPDVYDRYTKQVDERHARMVWTHPGMRTYYRNSQGRVVVNSPFRNLDFWRMTRNADLEDFVTEQRMADQSRDVQHEETKS